MLKFILILFLLSGCTTIVKDVDFSKNERDQINKIKAAQNDVFNNKPTPDYVKLATEDGVYIEAIKLRPVTGHQGIKLEVWKINAVNTTEEDKCLTINWKLMDFELNTELPYEFLILANETLSVGRMQQTIWSFDGAAIAIPPSGYIDGMRAREAKFEEKTGKLTCDELEKDIQEPK